MLNKSHILIFILILFVNTIKIYSQGSIDRPQPLEVPQGESKDEKPEDLNASFFYWVGEYKKLATYKKDTDKKILDLINKYNTDISLLLNENKILEQVIYEKEKTIKDYKILSEKDRETIERLEAELKALRGAKDKAERSFSDTSIQLDSKIKEIESKSKEISELKKLIETKTQAEKQLSEKIAKSEENLAKTQAELKNLQKQVEDAQKALQMEKASSEKAKEDLKSLQSQTGELQKTIFTQKDSLDKNKTEMENLRLTIKNLETKNLEAQNLLQMEKYKTDVLSKDLLESQKKTSDQQKQINELQKQLSNLQTLMQAEKQSYEKQIIDLGNKEKEFSELNKKILAYQKQITELQAQIAESEKKHKTNSDASKLEIENLQKQISEIKNQSSDTSKKDTKIKELEAKIITLEEEKKKNSELLAKLNQEKTKILDLEKSEHQKTSELKTELESIVLQLKKDNSEMDKKITTLTSDYNNLRVEYEEKLKVYNQEFEKSIALIDTLSKEKRESLETIEILQKEIANLKEKYEVEIKKFQQQFETLKNQTKNLETLLEKEIKKGHVNIVQNKDRIIINLFDKVCFDSGSADLTQDAKKILDKIESVLLHQSFSKIYIEGNTDDDPVKNSRFKDNWRLSSERASVVLDYILDKNRLKPEKFSITGNSRYNPLKGLDKNLNRRVDIILVP